MEWPDALPSAMELFPSMFHDSTPLGPCPALPTADVVFSILQPDHPNGLQAQLTKLVASFAASPQNPTLCGATIDESAGPVIVEQTAHIEPGSHLIGPCYVGHHAEIRHAAYVRQFSWICSKAVVGHASETKHSILLPGAKAPHFNYVGDSILGTGVNLGAGTKSAIYGTMVEKSIFEWTEHELEVDLENSAQFLVNVVNSVATASQTLASYSVAIHKFIQIQRSLESIQPILDMGEHMVQRLFGTDGIRGKIVPAAPDEKTALTALHEMRSVCPTLMRLVGEALGHLIDTLPGEGEHVVIGWDQRPGNKELVEGITLGLRLAGCEVTHIGVCATPALHYAVLWHKARMGCMMTASHNPATDSGIKVFDSNGYKTSPALEDEISSVAYALSEEEREIDQIDIQELSQPSKKAIGNWADKHHSEWLTTRFGLLKRLFGVKE